MSSDHIIVIPLTQGQQAVIDAVDADFSDFTWYAQKTPSGYYAARWVFTAPRKKHAIRMHRAILERKLGRRLQTNELCDHIDGDPLNNRRENLRIANRMQNAMNSKRRSNNESGYKGIYWNHNISKWHAHIQINGQKVHLGNFDTPEAAHQAYCEAADRHFGEFARFD